MFLANRSWLPPFFATLIGINECRQWFARLYPMSFRTLKVIPILRIFSIEKAREFYLDYAGFRLDLEHRFG